MIKKDKGYRLRHYTCDWCFHKFDMSVIYNASKKYSTVVQCPKCTRKIPTWNVKRFDCGTGIKHKHEGR